MFHQRHVQGDWGELCEEDRLANNQALIDGSRMLSTLLTAVQTIARHREVDLPQILDARYDGKTAEELTVVEANLFIDQLKSFPTPGDDDLTAVSWQ